MLVTRGEVEQKFIQTYKAFLLKYGSKGTDGIYRMAGKSARAIHIHETKLEDALREMGYDSDSRYRILSECRDQAELELIAEGK